MSKSLKNYRKKRDLKKTLEPSGAVTKKRGKALRFVVQKHAARRLHYDFRIELDGVLKSWAVPKGPSLDPHVKRLAMMVEDHPLQYGSFEGKIPKDNYGAGEVIVWDSGVYASASTATAKNSMKDIRRSLAKGHLELMLFGKKLKGRFDLIKIRKGAGSDRTGENAWLLIKYDDEYASNKDVTKDDRSVLSGKILGAPTGISNTKRELMPHNLKPMLAVLAPRPFDKNGWIFEIKWDGYRAITEIENGNISLYSRNGNSFLSAYPPIASALKYLSKHDIVIDGEIVAIKNGRPDFHSLQYYGENMVPLQYAVFDLLYLDGKNYVDEPLRLRKEVLRSVLPSHPNFLYSDHIEKQGISFFKEIQKKGLEGVIAKDKNGRYLAGKRSASWQKIKNLNMQEAIILGYTKPRGSRKYFGALVLGAFKGRSLVYIGHSGGGFSERELEDLYAKFQTIKTLTSPIKEKIAVNSLITWLKPQLVCQVSFTEWTQDGKMRHPVYQGLRTDKRPQEVRIET